MVELGNAALAGPQDIRDAKADLAKKGLKFD